MVILSRQVTTSKTYEEVCQTIQSSAYRFSKCRINGNAFSMYCAKRSNKGTISLTHINGTITQYGKINEIVILVHANLGTILGVAISLLGILEIIYCVIMNVPRWIPGVGMIVLGMLIVCQSFREGKSHLDKLERKLTN